MSRNEDKSKHVRVNKEFYRNVNELYPQEPSFNQKTKKLNEILQEMLHGKKNQ